jgi:hypothetical protein
MNPKPVPSAPQPRPRVVVPGVTRRDIILGLVVGLAVIGIIVMAVLTSSRPPGNLLTGEVRSKNAPGLKETLMVVSRKGVKESTADTGYSLKVWVESEKREFEVMVMKEVWDAKKIGDKLDFLRPPSEQR